MAAFLRDGLISFVKCNEAAGSSRPDSIVATGNDMSEIGGLVTQGSALFSGSINSATFSGTGSNYLSNAAPTGLDRGAGSFTIGIWTRMVATTTFDQGVVAKFTPTGNQRQFILFFLNAAANYRFGVSSDGLDDFSINDTVVPAFNAVQLVIAWYDGSDNTVNIQSDNGTINSAAGPSSVFASSAGLDIGRADIGAERTFRGELDELGIWDRVLTAEEKSAWWNGGSGLAFEFFQSGGVGFYDYYWQERRQRRRALK